MKVFKGLTLFGAVLAGVLFLGNFSSVSAQRGGGMTWRGTVDDHVQIVIRGRSARTNTLSGTRYNDARYDFDNRGGNWGNNNNYNYRASVSKEDGRGKVWIVQQPNRRNNYTTIVQIDDTKGGADRYRFRLTWD